ncbi:MAG: hypothetical protein EBQ94_02975 [Flavobacteriales bacterium]|nr:hypothetical protein [Flavobacteriales bacterium]NCA20254.1 hypothetical protein [Crocinitomicaceae bacterium]
MENFFVTIGFSYTLSKLLPYLLMLLFGLIIGITVMRKRKKSLKVIVSVFLMAAFFGLYFAIYPIYEGDFSNNFYVPKSKVEFPSSKSLIVLSLPNCPFCIQSTESIKAFKSKNSKLKVEYWIMNGTPADSLKYKKLVGEAATCSNKKNTTELFKISKGGYPTFVLSDHKKALKVWGNESFGVRAWDAVISEF